MAGNPEIRNEAAKASRLVGVWALEAIEDRLPDGRVLPHPDIGERPAGRLVYTMSGHVCVNFMREDRPPWADEDRPTGAERERAAAGYGAYAGRYTVNEREGFILHHVEVALIPNRVGVDLKRFFELSGDRLTLRPEAAKRGGEDVQRCLRWRRIG